MAKKSKHTDQAVEASRNGSVADASSGAREESGGGLGKLLFLLVLGAVVALLVSRDARGKLLDMLFGAEEEFDYSSTTMPVSEPPVGAATS